MCRSKPALPRMKRARLVWVKSAMKGRSRAEHTSRRHGDGLLEEVRKAAGSIRLRDFEIELRNGVGCWELRNAVFRRDRRVRLNRCSLIISWELSDAPASSSLGQANGTGA